jgi:transketolase
VRTAFIETLCELAEQDDRIWLLTGDLGYSVLERFAERFPGRFVNVGVAEQNMTGVAAGLALCGKIVFTYSIANFPTLRCLELIRNDVCYHNLNVKIVAVGGGLAYGSQGYTHHGVEDLAIMRALPNMTVIAPADPVETRAATTAMVDHLGPCYLRLGKASAPVHQMMPDFQIGKAIVVRPGGDITLISCGGMLQTALEVAELLAVRNIAARVLSMHTIKPIDVQAILAAAKETKMLVAIEEHGLVGGLGSAVAEVLASAKLNGITFKVFGIPDKIVSRTGGQDYLRSESGLSSSAIAHMVLEII